MHTISSYCGNSPTNKQTQPQTHRQDQLQYTAPQPVRSINTGLQSEAHNLISFIKNSVKLTTSTKLSTFDFASFLFGSYNSLCCTWHQTACYNVSLWPSRLLTSCQKLSRDATHRETAFRSSCSASLADIDRCFMKPVILAWYVAVEIMSEPACR